MLGLVKVQGKTSLDVSVIRFHPDSNILVAVQDLLIVSDVSPHI